MKKKFLIFFLTFIFSGLLSFGVAFASAPATGLVGYWNFDAGSGTTATDSSGNGNTGTLVNVPAWTTGKVGSGALNFNGGSYITVANQSSFNFERTSPFTLSAWVNYAAGSGTYFLINKEDVRGNFPGIDFKIDATNLKLGVFIIDASGNSIQADTANNSLSSGVWHNVAMIYDGSSAGSGVHLYIDGVDKTSGTSGPISQSILNNNPVQIGVGPGANQGYFQGQIDEVRIYNRALSTQEISDIYTDGGGVTPPPPPGGDTTPPSLSAIISSSVTSTSATITWNTDETSDSQVEYGLTTGYGSASSLNSTLITSHAVSLSSLSASTVYHYRVKSKDAAGNLSTGGDNTFTTSSGVTPPGGTITAASCNVSDVQAAFNLATAGSTIYIPAGTCHWTGNVSLNAPANLTVLGAGDLNVVGGGDRTIIIDDSTQNGAILGIGVPPTGTFRMAGITFQGGIGTIKDNGVIGISGGAIRLDHIHFNVKTYSGVNIPAKPLEVVGVTGVLDHSILDFYGGSAIYVYGSSPDGMGNSIWNEDTNFGSSNFFFIEDNQVSGDTRGSSSRISDCFTAGRLVVRYNTLIYTSGPEVHATGHAGDDRGCRATENYGNHFMPPQGGYNPAYGPAYDMHDASSGTSLVWGNVADTDALKQMFIFNVTRKNSDTYGQSPAPNSWGYCGTEFTGTGSVWDQNSNTTAGYACIDQPGRGKGDLLTGYFPTYGPGKVNSTTGTPAWPHQALEPIYIWMNAGNAATGWGGAGFNYSDNSKGRVVANRDYYPQATGIQTSPTTPFNGTTGTGWGTLANRPTTCTTGTETGGGVGYWATDSGGNWNTINGTANDGTLYKCTSTNTWTLYYTPYAYPHPLVSGQTPPPPPLQDTTPPSTPTNLSATAVSSSGINLSWTASTDNTGVSGYKIFRNGTQIATSVTNSYSNTGLTASTLYSYTVSAYDAAGNTSSQSSSASATTQSAVVPSLAGDLNLDHIVNSLDFSLMNSVWLTSNATSDLDHNGIVNSLDFSVLSSQWGQTW